MSHEVNYDEANNIVNVVLSGTLTLEERKKGVDETSFLYAHLQPLQILVNIRKHEMDLTFKEQKMFGEYLASLPKIAHARVAVLHEESHNPSLIIDTFAFSNGYKVAEFDNDKDALDWLKDE